MESIWRFLAIVTADARQRWRAPRLGVWLLILIAATWLCFPAAEAGYRVLGIGPFRTTYSSVWAGMTVAMLMSWLSLLGFYLVRGTLTRDIESNVWQLLVATPMSRTSYLIAKWMSHLLVLGAIALGMLVVSGVALAVRAESPDFDVFELLQPLLVLGLPALGICALCAVLFDLVPVLRRSLGNALYVIVWIGMLATASVGTAPQAESVLRIGDVHGISVFKRELSATAAAQGLDVVSGRICMLCGSAASQVETIAWKQWVPNNADLLGRAFWLLLPLPLLALAARGMDRAAAAVSPGSRRRLGVRSLRWVQVLLRPMQRWNALALVSLELQHVLRERSVLAWVMLLLAWVVQLVATPSLACLGMIGAWSLVLPVFSRAALRERESATAAVVFSSTSATARLLRTRVQTLLLLGTACVAPALARFAVGEPLLCLAVLGIIVSLTAWALALGSLTGSARPFELLFVLGAMLALNGIGVLDASVAPSSTLAAHLALLPPASLLLAFAWPRRCAASVAQPRN